MKELEHPINSVPKGRRFCTICGEVKRETHFDGDSTHCDTCVRNMLRTRVHAWAVVVCVCLALLCAASVYLGVHTASFCIATRRADALAQEKRLNTACAQYEEAVAGLGDVNASLLRRDETDETQDTSDVPAFFVPGVHTWERYAGMYARAHSDYEAASRIRDSLDAAQAAKSPRLSALLDATGAYDDVFAQVQAVSQTASGDAPEDMPYDELMQTLDAVIAENKSRYYKGYALLFKASATQYHNADDPMAADPFFDEAMEYLPDEYANIYSGKAQSAMQAQDWDALRKAGEGVLAQNRDQTDAYEWIAVAAARQGDAEAAQETAERLREILPDQPASDTLRLCTALIADDPQTARAVLDSTSARWNEEADTLFSTLLADQTLPAAQKQFLESYTQYATYAALLCLLENNNDDALLYGYERAFNYAYYLNYLTGSAAVTQHIVDVASICASLCKDQDALDTIAQAGEPGETAKQVIDGKLALRDVLQKGDTDLL